MSITGIWQGDISGGQICLWEVCDFNGTPNKSIKGKINDLSMELKEQISFEIEF